MPPRGLPPERPPLLEREAPPELLNEDPLLRVPEKLLRELEDLGLENELLVELELLKPRELAGLYELLVGLEGRDDVNRSLVAELRARSNVFLEVDAVAGGV